MRWFSLLVLFGAALAVLTIPGLAQSPDSPAGRDAIARGNQAFRAGDVLTATRQWSDAINLCHAAGALDLEAQARARRGEAYRVSGYYRDATADLDAALKTAEQTGDQDLVAASSGALGNLALLLRRSAPAEPLLRRSRDLARQLHDAELLAASANDLGNLLAATNRAVDAERTYSEAVTSADQAHDETLAATAEVNEARLALSRADMAAAERLLGSAVARLQTLPPNFPTGLALVAAGSVIFERDGALTPGLTAIASRALHAAAVIAQTVRNPTLTSLAEGSLGRYAERMGQLDEAGPLTDQALFAAQQAGAGELTFRWSWQRARLARQRGQIDQAVMAYRAADTALEAVRQDIPVEYREGHSSYRASFEPFYLQYADLLLRQAPHDPANRAALLKEAQNTVEQLKESQLQDYFHDSCIAAFAQQKAIDQLAPGTAVLYPILLPDRLEILVSLGREQLQFTLPIPEPKLRQQVNDFRKKLEDSASNEYLTPARQLYDEIIRPLDPTLQQHAIDTLVVVPDGILRTIPFSALQDGNKFLIERYALATAPSLHLINPRPLAATAQTALVVGISESVDGFVGLPHVADEAKEVHKVDGGELFLNNDFTRARFEAELKQTPFSVVHIASHGQFGTDPSQTFVLAFDGHLTMDDLERTIKYGERRADALELLTLDACETALGDDRAALGLAGIALKAGARSALATLWFISDEASGDLTVRFYEALKTGKLSRAKALQAAQQQLIADPLYSHPAFWAPFLLIGDWL
jgi:CHAT domain-containing protein